MNDRFKKQSRAANRRIHRLFESNNAPLMGEEQGLGNTGVVNSGIPSSYHQPTMSSGAVKTSAATYGTAANRITSTER